jgi:type I restriction enzyme S subunit
MIIIDQKIVPKGWRRKKFEEIVVENKKSLIKVRDAKPLDKYPFFTNGEKVLGYSDFFVDGENIFMNTGGIAGVKFFNGKAAYSTDIYSFKAKNDAKYLYYILLNDIDKINKNFFSGSGLKHLQKSDFRKYELKFPATINEQKKIAEILSAIDEEIQKTDEIISRTEKLKKGLMQDLFTKGIGHTKFKKTKIGDIPERWEIKIFEEFATLQRGFDLPTKNRIPGEYPLVTSNGITSTHNESKVKAPGVVTGRSGTLGNVFYIENDFWPLNTTLYVKDFHNNNEKFVYYKIQSFGLARFGAGTGVPTLNRNIVHKEVIAIPDHAEQKKIADILSSTDDKININNIFKEKLTKLKKGLMRDLLSGGVRVNAKV